MAQVTPFGSCLLRCVGRCGHCRPRPITTPGPDGIAADSAAHRRPARRASRGLPLFRALAAAALVVGSALGSPARAQTPATLSVSASANPVSAGASFTLTASLGGLSPTGTVDFLADGVALCPAVPVAASGSTGIATCTTSTLPVGDHSIVAVYSGDADDGAASSASLLLWVSTACRAPTAPTLAMPATTWLRSWRAGLASPSRLAVDAGGNVLIADGATGEVVVRTPAGASSVRVPSAARAVSVAAGPAGRIYVGDAEAGRVRAYDAAGSPEFDLGAGAGEFGHPGDIAVDPAAGEVFVSDTNRHLVGVYDAATGALRRTLGRFGRSDGQFHTPTGLALDATELLVADQLNYRIQAIDRTTGAFRYCLGTYSQSGFISASGGPSRSWGMAQGLALDAAGRLYLADAFQGVVWVIDRGAATKLGSIGAFGSGSAELRVPTDLAIDADGRLFVAVADSGKLETWGLDAYTDREASTHARATLLPAAHNRLQPPPSVRVVVEFADLPPSTIDRSTLRVNGLSPSAAVDGDADLNGQPDLALDVDASALFATLGGASGAVSVTGQAGGLAFDARAQLTLTADRVATVTTLTAPVDTTTAGTPITLTATIAGTTPSGTVDFANGATPLCTGATVVAGAAQCTTSALPAGFHGLTASYGGDADDAPSTSAPFEVLVLQAASTATLSSSANPAPAGLPLTLTAEVAGLAPGGSVEFLDGTVALCPAVVLAPVSATVARAQCTTSSLGLGVHALTARYGGDLDNLAALSGVLAQTIAQAATTTTLASAPNPSGPGAPVTFTATVTGSAPTGAVTVRDGAVVLCAAVTPVPQTATTSTAQCVSAALAAGQHAITAEFAGDAANLASVSAVLVHSVQSAPLAVVTLGSSTNPSTAGQAVTFTATVAGSAPTGSVNFNDGASVLCASVALAPLDAGRSSAACTSASLAAGTHGIVAAYAGDPANGAATSAPLSQVVNPAGQSTVSGLSATGSGVVTATIAGQCRFETWAFVAAPRLGAAPINPQLFPHGLFEFTTTPDCTPGGAITVAITYPRELQPGTRYWKYGPTRSQPSPHWYTIPATVIGATVSFTIVDGGLGDDDLTANGRIADAGGPSAQDPADVSAMVAIPALDAASLALIELALALVAWWALRRRLSLRDRPTENPR